jgi:hypothetical protein
MHNSHDAYDQREHSVRKGPTRSCFGHLPDRRGTLPPTETLPSKIVLSAPPDLTLDFSFALVIESGFADLSAITSSIACGL